MSYKKGDIVIIRFSSSDLSNIKKRPALIISNDLVNNTGDYLMVQIISRIRNDYLSLQINKTDFIKEKELPLKSCIRLHKIFLLNESLILSKQTALNNDFMAMVTEKVTELIP